MPFPGPIRHDSLPPALLQRVKKVVAVISEVVPQRLDGWLDDFGREKHPELELRAWEKVAGKFLLLTDPSDPIDYRKAVLGALLDCCAGVVNVNALAAGAGCLTREDIAKIVAVWSDNPSA